MASESSSSSSSTTERRRRRPKHDYHDVSSSSQSSVEHGDLFLLTPEVPTYFTPSKQDARSIRKAYRNPTSAYFIPGISGKPRCLDVNTVPEEPDHDSRNILESMKSISNHTKSTTSINTCSTFNTQKHGSSSKKDISAPTTSSACQRAAIRRKLSKSLEDVQSSMRSECVSPSQTFESDQSCQENTSPPSESQHLRNRLASVRSILKEDTRRKKTMIQSS